MRYEFIDEYRYEHRISTMCRVLGVSRSGYYSWWRQEETLGSEMVMVAQIKEVYEQNRGLYGSPRIAVELRDRGVRCTKNRIARIMRKNGIVAKTKRKFKVTTNSKHTKVVSENLVKQEFHAERPNQLWTSDITYVWTKEGWLYLALILDVCTRMIVGWSVSARLTSGFVVEAFDRALRAHKTTSEMIFHSDRGSQYASDELRAALSAVGIRQSMSGTGNCYDNAITESLIHTIKTELIYLRQYETREEATSSIFEYIEVFYNRRRRHSALNYKSPFDFQQQHFLS